MSSLSQRTTAVGAPVDERLFRTVLGRFPTGAVVVTARTSQGPVGITANSVTSVSLDPPLLLWCIANAARRRRLFQAAGLFVVNILSEDQQEVARAFATRMHEPFHRVPTRLAVSGAPVLLDALAFADCRVVGEFEMDGAHLIPCQALVLQRPGHRVSPKTDSA